MKFVANGFSNVLAIVGLGGPALEEVVQQNHEVHARLDELQARVEALSIFGDTLALFWGPSYTDLRSILRDGCEHHLNELRKLRADLDRELEAVDDLAGLRLRGAAKRLRTLAARAEELRRRIRTRELFWEEEAYWTLDLLGARTPSVWPPERTDGGDLCVAPASKPSATSTPAPMTREPPVEPEESRADAAIISAALDGIAGIIDSLVPLTAKVQPSEDDDVARLAKEARRAAARIRARAG